jgi:hypothetical protein
MSEFVASRSWSHQEGAAQESHSPSSVPQTHAAQAPASFGAPVQLRAEPGADEGPTPEEASAASDVRALAGKGTATAGGSLPHFDVVQAAFGHHDLSGLVAHTGADAGETAAGMGAKGYTAGRHVVLGPGADLFTVAH